MNPKIITFGISKGGCTKSTSSAIVAYMLSKRNEKVLAIDMDMQANLTNLLSGVYDVNGVFENKTVMEAILEGNAEPYIIQINEYLDLLPSNHFLALLVGKLIKNKKNMKSLEQALKPVMYHYDWIIIDTPPALSEHTYMPLCIESKGGSYTVIMFDGSLFCYYGIKDFMDIVDDAKTAHNPNLKVAGICFSLVDEYALEFESMRNLIDRDFPNMRFNTILKKRAAIKRLPITGFKKANRDLRTAIKEIYNPFLEELLNRVEEK